jgi:hypothetical protein
MADVIGVCEKTFNNWKKKHPAFFKDLKAWKDEFDEQIERNLAKLAMGFKYQEIEEYHALTGDSSKPPVVVRRVVKEKEVIPQYNAISKWLNNRKPKEWRDKIDHGLLDKNDEPIDWSIELTHVYPSGEKVKDAEG